VTAVNATSEAKRGGVLVRVGSVLHFVPASIAIAVAPAPKIARVAGAPPALLGVALHDGDVVPVIAIGDGHVGVMLVCGYMGEKIGLMGGRVEGTGVYEVDRDAPDAVVHAGERATTLDVAAAYAGVQGEGWAGRWRA